MLYMESRVHISFMHNISNLTNIVSNFFQDSTKVHYIMDGDSKGYNSPHFLK